MKRFFSILLLFAVILTQATGCAGQSGADIQPHALAQESPSPAAQFPMTVTDQAGNTVTLEYQPQRIVSGYYISSSACIALGLKDRLVGIEEKSEARPIYQQAAPELIESAANVGSAKAFDLEACLAAEPDLVILPGKAKDYAATLGELGIPAIVVNPEGHQKLVEMLRLIAQVTGIEERAEELVSYYDAVITEIDAATQALDGDANPVVYFCSPSSYMATAPRGMYQADLIRTAGGINAGDSLDGDSWTEVSYEQILAMNPDVIIIPTNNMANGQPDYHAEDLMADPNLADVAAVQSGAVYNMPAGLEAWDSPVPSGVLGMLWLLSTLHPELCGMERVAEKATEFYDTFYGFILEHDFLVEPVM